MIEGDGPFKNYGQVTFMLQGKRMTPIGRMKAYELPLDVH